MFDSKEAPADGPRGERGVEAHSGYGRRVPFPQARSLKRELLAELRASWAAGQPVPLPEVLARWPDNPASDPDVASLLFEDHLHRGGPEGPATDQAEHFPEHREQLASLIRRHEVLRSLGGTGSGEAVLRLPDIGDQLFGFSLCQELGHGAFARVFRAEQGNLAARPVVLKVSGIEGDEPQTLAQLQHTHIVPIYSIHEDTRAGLRALCMPYFGGASLSRVLEKLWEKTRRPTSGRELVEALDAVAAPPLPRLRAPQAAGEGEAPGSGRAVLRGLSYVRAVAWVVARLAEALAHAHQRGVLHHDLKPPNVLLTAACTPMLLDFNLARSTANDAVHAVLGGTITYMPPEQLRAVAARDPALAREVNQRADIYSLGLILYEMLVSVGPFEQSASYTPLPLMVEAMALERSRLLPSPRKLRPDVPWGLESIARRCLHPDPARRYQQAEQLAEDLCNFLHDLPLRHAPELSLAERGRKWTRRHPRLTTAGTALAGSAAVLLAVALLLAGARARLVDTSARLAASQAQERRRAYERGKVRALFLVNTTSDRRDHLREGRKVCEETLNLYGVLEGDGEDHPDWVRLPEGERRQLREDTRELVLLLAGARVRLDQSPKTLEAASGLLDRAERISGLPPCRALWEDRAAFRARLGDRAGAERARERARSTPAVTSRDHYLLAMTHARERRYREAVGHLDEALRLEPRDYWSWMQRGLCHQEAGDFVLAASDFGACVGLWPDFAWGYFNRAWALARCGKKPEAIADYTRSLERDPDLQAALLNRGLLYLEVGQFQRALADLRRAGGEGGRLDDASLHSGLGVALEGLGRYREADAAFGKVTEREPALPADVRARLRLAYGFAVARRLPDRAGDAFAAVLRERPHDSQALYGRAMLAEHRGDAEGALDFYNRALAAAPDFEQARRFRAVLLARAGDFQAAQADINVCLGKEPAAGATLYGAACVAALQARPAPPATARQATRQALTFLRHALAAGYGRESAERDPDLEGIRHLPEFRQILAAHRPAKDVEKP